MRILWLSHVVPYPPHAGVLLRAYNLLRAVSKSHRVDLVAFVQEPLLLTFYPEISQGLNECRKFLEPLCESVTFLPIEKLKRPLGRYLTAAASVFSGSGYMSQWLQSADAEHSIAALVRQHQPDLAHLDFVGLASYRYLFRNVPATMGHHNAESQMLIRRSENEHRLLKRWFYAQEGRRLAAYEQQISHEYAAHFTCSDLDSARLSQSMPSARFVTIPNGVDVNFFTPKGVNKRKNSLIFVGTMNWYPNVDAILFLLREIYPIIRHSVPNTTLDIVGAGAPDAVKDLAQQTPGVTIHGYLPEIRTLIESASVYVCPIRDGGGTKLKLLDAFAMQKCVVAHPIACEGIDVTADVNVVLGETASAFAAQVIRLLKNPTACEPIGAAARELVVARYSFESIGAAFARTLENIYEQSRTAPTPG